MVGRVLAPPPASARRPAQVRCEGGGGARPHWTEAAAGIGRGRSKGEPRRRGDSKPRGGKGSGGEDGGSKAGRGGGAPPKPGPGEDFSRKRRRKQREAATAEGGSGGRGGRGDARATRGGRGGRGRERAERYASLQAAYRSKATNASASSKRDSSSSSVKHYEGPVAGAPRSDAAVTARNCDALRRHYEPRRDVDDPRRIRSRDLKYAGAGFRLVRCMPQLRRREADEAVSAGRVRVNGALVKPSTRVRSGDVVTLDGVVLDWEPFAAATESAIDGENGFVYLKYNKPRGVTCTMEASQRSSMMYALKDELKVLGSIPGGAASLRTKAKRGSDGGVGSARVFPVGRLDRDSDGLVLLTDDGRVPEALLDPARKAPKTYEVDVVPAPTRDSIAALRAGVVITTTQQRDGVTTTAPTKPCSVDVIKVNESRDSSSATLRFELREGRNRQIRKMCEAVGMEVARLQRVSVGGVWLDESTLEVGGVRALSGDELDAVGAAVSASGTAGGAGGDGVSSRDVGRARVRRLEDGERANTRGGGGWGAEIAAERGKR